MSAVERGALVLLGGICITCGVTVVVGVLCGQILGLGAGLLVLGGWAMRTAERR